MKRPSRFAILGTRGIPASYGGFETFAEEMAVRLVARGIEVSVYCEKEGEGQPQTFKGVKLKYVHRFPMFLQDIADIQYK